MSGLTIGSLFDGIAGFPLAASRHGMEPRWASEIESYPMAVSRRHFPAMKHLGDVTKVNGAEVEPVDIITFGSPCQDLSGAGKRAGLEGAKSGLFTQAVRIIREMQEATHGEYPKALVFENVPGLLSSNNGADFVAVLDHLQDLRFVVDPQILDAQFMGVPQRRRRVFIACISVNHILRMTTPISVSIIGQLLTEILHITLVEHLRASGREPQESAFSNGLARDGLKKRMRLFGLESEGNWLALLRRWDETLATQQSEQSSLVLASETLITAFAQEGTGSNVYQMNPVNDEGFLDTSRLWRSIWAEVFILANSSITSTPKSETTQSIIYTCSLLSLNMAERIAQWKHSSPNYSEEASYSLTVLQECMNYARQASSHFLDGMEWLLRWGDYFGAASDCAELLERHLRERCAAQVQSESLGVSGDYGEGEEARQGSTAGATDGVGAGSYAFSAGQSSGAGSIAFQPEVSPTLRAGASGTNMVPSVLHPNKLTTDDAVDFIVQPPQLFDMTHANEVIRPVTPGLSPTLNARMGTGGNQVPVMLQPISFGAQNSASQGDSVSDKVTPTLDKSKIPAIAFGPGGDNEISHALRAQASRADKPSSSTYVVEKARPWVAGSLMASGAGGMASETDFLVPVVEQCLTTGTGRRYDAETETLIPVAAIDCRNSIVTEELSGTLQAKSTGGYSLNYQNPVMVPISQGGEEDFVKDEADAGKVLLRLRHQIGEKAFTQWCLRSLVSFQQTEVLRSEVHGQGVREQTPKIGCEVVGSPQESSQSLPSRSVHQMRDTECPGCTPQGWELAEQFTGQPGAHMSELPQPYSQAEAALLNLRETSQRVRILRQALSAVQEMGTPPSPQSQSKHISYIVRRLTPTEAERLQGMPDGWTEWGVNEKGERVNLSDTARYKALDNGLAMPPTEFVMRRIAEVLSPAESEVP